MIYTILHGNNETVIDMSMVQGIDAEWKIVKTEALTPRRTWRNFFKRPYASQGVAYMQIEFSVALTNGISKKICLTDKESYELLKKAWINYKRRYKRGVKCN